MRKAFFKVWSCYKVLVNKVNTVLMRPVDKMLVQGDHVIDLLKKSNSLNDDYIAALKQAEQTAKHLQRVLEEILLHGETERLAKLLGPLEKEHERLSKRCNKIKKAADELDVELNKAQEKYDRGINRFGKFWSLFTFLIIVIFLFIVSITRSILQAVNPEFKNAIDAFGLAIDPKFYELTVQIILALTLALFIRKIDHDPARKANWWRFSKYAMGVTCSLVGMATCLYVVGGNKPGIYTFSLVVFCLAVLFFSALRPLLLYSNTRR